MQVNDPDLQPRMEPRPADDALFLQGLLEGIATVEARMYALLADMGASPLRRVRAPPPAPRALSGGRKPAKTATAEVCFCFALAVLTALRPFQGL